VGELTWHIPQSVFIYSLPGVARRLVTFFVLPKKVTKKSRPQSTTSSRFPALLDWSGFLTNSHDPLRVHVLKHVRQNSLTSLCYSVAEQGREKQKSPKPYFVGWANCPPIIKLPRGQFAHPTTPAEIER
jgi:hypothetical protein